MRADPGGVPAHWLTLRLSFDFESLKICESLIVDQSDPVGWCGQASSQSDIDSSQGPSWCLEARGIVLKVCRNFHFARVGPLFLEVTRKSLRRTKGAFPPKNLPQKAKRTKKASAPRKANASPNGSDATAIA